MSVHSFSVYPLFDIFTLAGPKVMLMEPCVFGDVCLDSYAQCRGGYCQCNGNFMVINNRCGKSSSHFVSLGPTT